MAKAIRQISREVPNEAEEQDKAVQEILRELAENKEAILALLETVKGLHSMKVLDAASAFFQQADEVGAIVVQQANQPAVHNIIKSGFGLFKFLGALKPEQLQSLLDGVTLGLKRMSETGDRGKKQSIWKMRRRLRSPEIRAAMTTMVDFMEGMGEVFLRNRETNK